MDLIVAPRAAWMDALSSGVSRYPPAKSPVRVQFSLVWERFTPAGLCTLRALPGHINDQSLENHYETTG
jgi:hypothetical protein